MAIKYSKYYLGDEKPIELNFPQMLSFLAPQKVKINVWGRGAGKSTLIGDGQAKRAFNMPRCSQFLVGATYSQMLKITLPSTIDGLSRLGYHQNVHFYVGRKAPAKFKWPEAYQPPINYDHAIHWITGSVTHLISMDMLSGRGLNLDGGDGDEAALLDKDRFSNNVLKANRGNEDRFGGNPLHHGYSLYTSMPRTTKGKWIFEYEELARMYPEEYFFLRASAEFNRHNLGDAWFRDQQRTSTKFEYNTEVLNIQPGTIEGGFYPQLNEDKHTYVNYDNGYLLSLGHNYEAAQKSGCLADADLQRDKPIDIACDYGAAINFIVANQDYDDEARYLSAMYVLSPSLIGELIDNFCAYYNEHRAKHVNYYYDHTAIGKDAGRSESYSEIVIKTFIKHKWTVNPIYVGQAPSHDSKYNFWGNALQEKDPRLPKQRFNKNNCKYLIISMQQAGVLQGANGFQKDKRPEKDPNAIDQETTHASDACDTIAYFKYAHRTLDTVGDVDLPT